jgi:hypothetical protein
MAGNISPDFIMTAKHTPERRRRARGIKANDGPEAAGKRHRAVCDAGVESTTGPTGCTCLLIMASFSCR